MTVINGAISFSLSSKIAFDDWKQLNFPLEGDAHDIYRAKRKDYRSKLRDFLNHFEVDKIKNLCTAADCYEKLFWKLLRVIFCKNHPDSPYL